MSREDCVTPSDTSPLSCAHLAGKFMAFKLADEEFGLEVLKVREIIAFMQITRVPRAQDFVRGVINLRGKVIPVVDLRLKLGMPAIEATDQTVIIVVQVAAAGRTLTMGLLVDQVLEVLSVDASNIEPPPSLMDDSIDMSFILGVGKAEKRVIFLIDVAKVLTNRELGEVAAA